MPVVHDFPNEILLQFFPHFCLKSLVAGWGVYPTRCDLLRLYKFLIKSPAFLKTRPWTLDNLRHFDRQAYIDALFDQHNDLPDDFCLWILEWPAQAVIDCAWPGLPYTFCKLAEQTVDRTRGYNVLGHTPPLVHTIQLNMGYILEWGESCDTGPYYDSSDDDSVSGYKQMTGNLARSQEYTESDEYLPDIWEEVPALLIHKSDSKIWLVLNTKRALPFTVYDLMDN
ncbi:hypothetical protein B0H10DRAFT_1967109 [Mycena sp. CBHHK59/15]|nr:hypothetical protein B0H10DRAFT_1967109 [Mycena sp. CBHHK59/15]